MAMENGYLRVHYFHGQRLELADFEDNQGQIVERRRIHQRAFHSPGVVLGCLGDLRVSALGRGDLSLVVDPGLAVDGMGNEIFLPSREVIPIDLRRIRPPQTVHVVIRQFEEPADFVEDPDDPEYQGYRRIVEKARLEIVERPPEPEAEVELARVRLSEGVEEIRDPAAAEDPGPDEIDLRFVPRAACAAPVPADLAWAGRTFLARLSRAATEFVRRYDLSSFREVRWVSHAARLALHPPPSLPTFAECLTLLLSILDEAAGQIAAALPRLRDSRPVRDLASHIASAPAALPAAPEPLHRAVRSLREICSDLEGFLEEAPQAREEGWGLADLEAIKVRSGDFPPVLEMGGRWYRRMDWIDVGDRPSEEDHEFRIVDCRDDWSMRREFSYPDRAVVSDKGRAHAGGYTRFLIRNLIPGRDLLLIRRLDYLRAEGATDIEVGGQKVPGPSVVTGRDPRHRWRNWPIGIQGALVTAETMEVRMVPLATERGIHLYTLWFYQPA